MRNPYDILDIDRDATDDEIKLAHRSKAKETHPDVKGGDRTKFEDVQFAKTLLLDHRRRQKYDATGDATEETADTMLSAAVGIMINFFDTRCREYFHNGFNPMLDPRRKNMIRDFHVSTHAEIAGLRDMISNMDKGASVFKDMIDRTTTDEKNNFLVQHYNREITKIAQEKAKAERRIEELTFAIELSKKYGFRFEEMDPTVHPGFVTFVASRS